MYNSTEVDNGVLSGGAYPEEESHLGFSGGEQLRIVRGVKGQVRLVGVVCQLDGGHGLVRLFSPSPHGHHLQGELCNERDSGVKILVQNIMWKERESGDKVVGVNLKLNTRSI